METGEAEMIGIDFVAKGGGNATAIAGGDIIQAGSKTAANGSKKGKGRVDDSVQTNGTATEDYLSAEDEERRCLHDVDFQPSQIGMPME